MRALLFAGGVFLVSLGPASAVEQCDLKQAASLDMNTEPGGTISVPVTINNLPVLMLADTGSIESSITEDIADQLALRRSPAFLPMEMAGGVLFTQQAQADSFRIGTLNAAQFKLYVVPRGILGNNYSGLLGPDIMSNYDIEIDFAGSKFNIFSQDHCPGRVVYWTRGGYAEVPMTVDTDWHITVPVKLDGADLNAVVDTGAEHTFMTMATAKRVLGITENDPRIEKLESISLNGAKRTDAFRYPFQSLTFKDISVQNPNVVIVQDSGMKEGMPDIVLGVSVLRQLHVYIAYKEQKLYLTAAEAR
ncbi:MAG: aspartyl protease family protein [Proteobacteria bacterium]|nr:aspartyl protease family protein [Pseudomonadota bacterium]